MDHTANLSIWSWLCDRHDGVWCLMTDDQRFISISVISSSLLSWAIQSCRRGTSLSVFISWQQRPREAGWAWQLWTGSARFHSLRLPNLSPQYMLALKSKVDPDSTSNWPEFDGNFTRLPYKMLYHMSRIDTKWIFCNILKLESSSRWSLCISSIDLMIDSI